MAILCSVLIFRKFLGSSYFRLHCLHLTWIIQVVIYHHSTAFLMISVGPRRSLTAALCLRYRVISLRGCFKLSQLYVLVVHVGQLEAGVNLRPRTLMRVAARLVPS